MAKRINQESQHARKPMLPRERCDYSAIVDRPPLKLPDGARVVFWSIVNLEVWDIGKPMARQVLAPPTGVTQLPDVPNWSWHEYGMRVGVWRFFDLFKQQNIRPTLAINARVCEDYARVAQQAKNDGWEFMGHSYEQGPIHKEPDQKAMIARSLDVLTRFCGKRPVGWLGPGLTKHWKRRICSRRPGIKYIGDWVYDDEPSTIRTDNGPLVTLPYTMDTQRHSDDGGGSTTRAMYLLKRAIDQFDRLYAEGEKRAKIFALAIHPYLSGQPHRIKYLEAIYDYTRKFDGVLYWTGEEILDWYLQCARRNDPRRRAAGDARSSAARSRPRPAAPAALTINGWPTSSARRWRRAFRSARSPPPRLFLLMTSASCISTAASASSPRHFWNFPIAWPPPTAFRAAPQLIKTYAPVFSRIDQQYGVPAPVIVAFWALESDFGANMGNYHSLSSIASLAYDCRRADRFRPQLLDALSLIERGDLRPDEMIGSWAGELGQTQMMPSEYYQYAVDYDGDGKRNLLRSAPDVLGSTANYLLGLGWRRGEPWLTEVRVPATTSTSRGTRPIST